MFKLNDSLIKVPGIGPQTYLNFQARGLLVIKDLLLFFPIRYEDFSLKSAIAKVQSGEKVTILGIAKSIKNEISYKNHFSIQKLTIEDKSGSIEAVWFNQPYLSKNFKIGDKYLFSGLIDIYKNKTAFRVNEFEEYTVKPIHTSRIIPYYSETLKASSKLIRKKIDYLLSNISLVEYQECLPENIILKESLLNIKETIFNLHFPKNLNLLEKANYRLNFEKTLLLLLNQEYQRNSLSSKKSSMFIDEKAKQCVKIAKSKLPFKLTNAQNRVTEEILNDLSKQKPMNRILVGDVGSGKTIPMILSSLAIVSSNKKVIVITPTQVLANQHFQSFKTAIKNKRIILLTSESKKKAIKSDFDILISTHAAFYLTNNIFNVGLIIVDEQHKFGVIQRQKLYDLTKEENALPHLLTVSATPIPRSLALVIYGNLEISTIDEMPADRLLIKTIFVSEQKRERAYAWVKNQIKVNKSQIFVVCPLIEETKNERTEELKSVQEEYVKLKTKFSEEKIEILHSKVKNKELIINEFKNHKIDILITTTVVEVGVDIPGADIIFIEDADRFGLAQLHQLRGRVGRNNTQAFCLLFSNSKSEKAQSRIKTLEKISNGFQLAEIDLKYRGAGNLIGSEQHGFLDINSKYLYDPVFLTKVKSSVQELLAKKPKFKYNSIIVQKNLNSKNYFSLN